MTNDAILSSLNRLNLYVQDVSKTVSDIRADGATKEDVQQLREEFEKYVSKDVYETLMSRVDVLERWKDGLWTRTILLCSSIVGLCAGIIALFKLVHFL